MVSSHSHIPVQPAVVHTESGEAGEVLGPLEELLHSSLETHVEDRALAQEYISLLTRGHRVGVNTVNSISPNTAASSTRTAAGQGARFVGTGGELHSGMLGRVGAAGSYGRTARSPSPPRSASPLHRDSGSPTSTSYLAAAEHRLSLQQQQQMVHRQNECGRGPGGRGAVNDGCAGLSEGAGNPQHVLAARAAALQSLAAWVSEGGLMGGRMPAAASGYEERQWQGMHQQQKQSQSGRGQGGGQEQQGSVSGISQRGGGEEWNGANSPLSHTGVVFETAPQQMGSGRQRGYDAAADEDARLSALYSRAMDWRRRCDERYDQARQEQQEAALEGCTFRPKINRKSKQLFKVRKTTLQTYIA